MCVSPCLVVWCSTREAGEGGTILLWTRFYARAIEGSANTYRLSDPEIAPKLGRSALHDDPGTVKQTTLGLQFA